MLHDVGHVQIAGRRLTMRKRHDRYRHRIAHPRGDLDLQFGVRHGGETGERAGQRGCPQQSVRPARAVVSLQLVHGINRA